MTLAYQDDTQTTEPPGQGLVSILKENMYKGHMDKTKGGRFKGRRWGWVGQRGSEGRKMETTALEQ